MEAKNREISDLRHELETERHKWEELLGTKLALDTEIAVYKTLLDGEERRVGR